MADEESGIDPSKNVRERLRKAIAYGERLKGEYVTQLHRLKEVLIGYHAVKRQHQVGLAAHAIDWAFASLAQHDRRHACKSVFFTYVDVLYVATDDAESTMSQDEREQLFVESYPALDVLADRADEVLSESVHRINALSQKESANPSQTSMVRAARVLFDCRFNTVEFAPSELLAPLVDRCVTLCMVVDLDELGGASFQELLQAINGAMGHAVAIKKAVQSEG